MTPPARLTPQTAPALVTRSLGGLRRHDDPCVTTAVETHRRTISGAGTITALKAHALPDVLDIDQVHTRISDTLAHLVPLRRAREAFAEAFEADRLADLLCRHYVTELHVAFSLDDPDSVEIIAREHATPTAHQVRLARAYGGSLDASPRDASAHERIAYPNLLKAVFSRALKVAAPCLEDVEGLPVSVLRREVRIASSLEGDRNQMPFSEYLAELVTDMTARAMAPQTLDPVDPDLHALTKRYREASSDWMVVGSETPELEADGAHRSAFRITQARDSHARAHGVTAMLVMHALRRCGFLDKGSMTTDGRIPDREELSTWSVYIPEPS